MEGRVFKYKGEFVFCPNLMCDFFLGKPNDGWIKDNGGKIFNLQDFPDLKEGEVVSMDDIQYYDVFNDSQGYKEEFGGFFFGGNVSKIEEN